MLPIALSFYPGETVEGYTTFLDVHRLHIFIEAVPGPRVVLSDQSVGMKSTMAHGVVPGACHQLYNWHFSNAMITYIRNAGYTSKEMEDKKDASDKVIEVGIKQRV